MSDLTCALKERVCMILLHICVKVSYAHTRFNTCELSNTIPFTPIFFTLPYITAKVEYNTSIAQNTNFDCEVFSVHKKFTFQRYNI